MTAHAPRLVDWSEGLVCICGKERCAELRPHPTCILCGARPGEVQVTLEGDAFAEVCVPCYEAAP